MHPPATWQVWHRTCGKTGIPTPDEGRAWSQGEAGYDPDIALTTRPGPKLPTRSAYALTHGSVRTYPMLTYARARR
ncbi:MAG: hypothetical protein MUD01_17065 [Chloroflexaceae bacterium]|nr:hypothetical protein [Chloroflexaceae bacterium]